MRKSGRVLFFLMCWSCISVSSSFADKPQTWWPDHVEGETFLTVAEVRGEELDQEAEYVDGQGNQGHLAGPDSAVLKLSLVKDEEEIDDDEPWDDEAEEMETIPDPLEPVNRAFFQFNDKLYFWVLKPVATGYETVLPELARVCIRNFFSNLAMPIRAVSCLLQGKLAGLGKVVVRFVVNSTVGFLGFQDVAKQALGFPLQDEDLGQVFAFYGIGPGFYLDLPFLGPYSLRSAVGWGGGLFVNPLNYAVDFWPNVGIRTYDIVNSTSLRIGEYEAMKEASLDPYVAMRDAYYQYRLNLIEK